MILAMARYLPFGEEGFSIDWLMAQEWATKLAVVAVILLITWVLAKAAKWSFAKLVDRVPLFQRAAGDGQSIGSSLGKIVSLFIWLIGLIAVLQRMGFDSVIKPIQGLLDSFITFVPNIVGAAVIFFVGAMVAKIVREIVETTLGAINFNRWANMGGVDQVTGNSAISKTIGTVVFVLIIVPVAIAALDVLGVPSISDPAKAMLQMVLEAVPLIIGASLLLGIGFLIARWVSGVLEELLPDLGFDRGVQAMGILPEGRTASGVISTIVSVAIMLFMAVAATRLLGFPELTNIVETVLAQGTNVIFGAALIAVGVVLGRIIRNLVAAAAGDGIAPNLTYWLTIGLFIFIGIKQMNIGGPIIDYAFAALAAGAAVAFALAFGLGGRDAAAGVLTDMRSAPPAKPKASAKSADQ
jgi:Conserved TM helix